LTKYHPLCVCAGNWGDGGCVSIHLCLWSAGKSVVVVSALQHS